jgi:hypothetical protein
MTYTTEFRNTRAGDNAAFEIIRGDETIRFAFTRWGAKGCPTEWATMIRHDRYETHISIFEGGAGFIAELRIMEAGGPTLREVRIPAKTLTAAMRLAVKAFECR